MGRRNAYKIYNINDIEKEVEISLYDFSQIISDRYITRFLKESSTIEDIVTLIEDMIECDWNERRVEINDYNDLVLKVIASTDWIVRYEGEIYHVDIKVQFLLRDEELDDNYEHTALHRVNIECKG